MFNDNVIEFRVHGIDMIGNCNNGSLIGLSKEGRELIEQYKKTGDMPGDEELTENQRMLLQAMTEQEYFANKRNKFQAAYVHVNNDCNLHCLGCYSHDAKRNQKQFLSYDELCAALRKLKALGVENIIISGGEPFLRKDIYQLMQYIKSDLGIRGLQIITNGTQSQVYEPEMIKEYVNELNISIDGYDIEHPTFIRDQGIFETVLKNAVRLKNAGVTVKLIATLHKQNIEQAGKYIVLSKQLGIPLSFSIMTCAGDFDDFERWSPTREQLEKYGLGRIGGIDEVYSNAKGEDFIVTARKSCGMGQRLISLDSLGNIYPCHMLHSDEVILGNILRDSEEEIYQASSRFAETVSVDKVEGCTSCEYKYVCGGGCRARAYTMYKNIGAEDDYCVLDKSYFRTVFHLLQKDHQSM